MNDSIITILVICIYTLLMPTVVRYLERRISSRWLIYVLLIIIALAITTVIGTIVSLLVYSFSHISQ